MNWAAAGARIKLKNNTARVLELTVKESSTLRDDSPEVGLMQGKVGIGTKEAIRHIVAFHANFELHFFGDTELFWRRLDGGLGDDCADAKEKPGAVGEQQGDRPATEGVVEGVGCARHRAATFAKEQLFG